MRHHLGAIAAPANRHDAPLPEPTLDTLAALGPLPAAITVHLDRGYDSQATRTCLAQRGLDEAIAHKKLVWCTERRAVVVAFWFAFSAMIIIVRRLIREGWTRYRWDGRRPRKP